MYFRSKSIASKRLDKLEAIQARAELCLRAYAYGPTECVLDSYLKSMYSSSLHDTALEIIKNAYLIIEPDGTVIIKFLNQRLDLLAQVITYGNGPLKGSSILTDCFSGRFRGKEG